MRYSHIIFCFLWMVFAGCQQDEVELQSNIIPLSPFKTVQLNSAFEVILVQDSIHYIEVQAHEDLLEKIEIDVNEKELSVTNIKKLKWTSPSNNIPTLYIHSDTFHIVNANESCNITTSRPILGKEFGLVLRDKANYANIQLDCDVFFYWNNFPCGGKLTLSGKTRELKLWNTAIMSVDAKDLVTEYALVENDSKGVCEVNVLNSIQYKITGTGNIHLYGNPPEVVKDEVTSSGQLVIF